MSNSRKTKQSKSAVNFAVFILTHGRPDRVYTYDVLRKSGYTGKIFLLVDDTDKTVDEYKAKYGDEVYVFPKQDAIAMTDSMDTQENRKTIIYARNYSFVVANKLGLDYFWQLDDDYTRFSHTWDSDGQYITTQPLITDMDACLKSMIDFMEALPQFYTIAISQGGDYIGGKDSSLGKVMQKGGLPRKAMNSFLFRAKDVHRFIGRINEDVNMYVSEGARGILIGTIGKLRLEQKTTQTNAGGMTDVYQIQGTYIKSFYSVIAAPSAITISEMGVSNKRLHHKVNWRYAVPKIINQKHKQ